jgi:UrcA family protein
MRVSSCRSRHHAAVATAALVLAWAATASNAGDRAATRVTTRSADGVAAERVDYGDVNLASASGQRTLLRRLDAAARRVCGAHAGRRLEEMQAYRGCVRDSLGRAVGSVGNAEVTALYQARTLPVGPS